MKNILLLCMLLACNSLCHAQKDPVREFIQQYSGSSNATVLRLQGVLLRLAARHAEDEMAGNLIKKINKLRLLSLENGEKPAREDIEHLMRAVKTTAFEDLIQVSEGEEKVNVLIREKDGLIHDILIVVSEAEEFVLLHIECALRFSDLNDLDMEVEGVEHLKTLPEKRIRV